MLTSSAAGIRNRATHHKDTAGRRRTSRFIRGLSALIRRWGHETLTRCIEMRTKMIQFETNRSRAGWHGLWYSIARGVVRAPAHGLPSTVAHATHTRRRG